MAWPDFNDQVALITGGTRGLGLAAGLALAERGARVALTHKWGSESEASINDQFAAIGATQPLILTADAAVEDDTDYVIDAVRAEFGKLDFFVGNVCVASRGGSLDSLKRRDIAQSLKYSAWPMLTYVKSISQSFGKPPSKIIAISSDGPDHHYPFYDYVAMSKAAMEAITRYLAEELSEEARVFVLRARQVSTASFSDMFPVASREMLTRAFASFEIEPQAVGKAVAALCSGYLDGLHGGTLSIDKGATFFDNTLTTGPILMEALDREPR